MNGILKPIGDFFLSAWIWNLTFDWFHPVITGISMFLILRLIFRRARLHALLISFIAQVVAFGLIALVGMGLTEYLQWHYEPVHSKIALAAMNSFYASLKLALVYTLFQSIYFSVGHIIWRYNLHAFLVMVFLSNGIGFTLSYMFIEMAKVWYYVE
jgi:hypothetical protein